MGIGARLAGGQLACHDAHIKHTIELRARRRARAFRLTYAPCLRAVEAGRGASLASIWWILASQAQATDRGAALPFHLGQRGGREERCASTYCADERRAAHVARAIGCWNSAQLKMPQPHLNVEIRDVNAAEPAAALPEACDLNLAVSEPDQCPRAIPCNTQRGDLMRAPQRDCLSIDAHRHVHDLDDIATHLQPKALVQAGVHRIGSWQGTVKRMDGDVGHADERKDAQAVQVALGALRSSRCTTGQQDVGRAGRLKCDREGMLMLM